MRSIFVLVPVFLVSAVLGQGPCTFVLRGTVTDEHDRQPLSFAEILLPASGRGAIADVDGRFAIDGLCAGTLVVRVLHLGCEPVERIVELSGDLVVDFELEHHALELAQFEIARSRPDERVGLAEHAIDARELEKGAGHSLAELLVSIPGVTLLGSGPNIAKPVIHGLSGNRILTLDQGIRQEDQQWGSEHAPGIDPLVSDRISVVKGAESVQYGSDAIAGVILIEPAALPRQAGLEGKLRALGRSNGMGGGANGMLQGGVKGIRGLGWRVQSSGTYLGDSHAPDHVLSNTGLREFGASASVGYKDHLWNATAFYSTLRRELGILRASHIGNLTDLVNAIQSGRPAYEADFTYAIDAPRQVMAHDLVKAEVGRAISARDRVVLTYGFQNDDRLEYDIRRGGRSGIPALDLSLKTHTADAVLKHWVGKSVHGNFGVSGFHQQNENGSGTGVRPLIPNYRKQSAAVYLVEHIPAGKRLELEAGMRWEATTMDIAKYDSNNMPIRPKRDFRNGAVGVGANWTVKDSLAIRFDLSTAYRPPHVSELYSEGLHHGAAAIELGDSSLISERAVKAVLDLDASWFNGRLRTILTLYTSRIDDFIYLRPMGVELTVRGAFPVFQYVATNASLTGLDATLRYDLDHRWAVRSRSSLVRGRDLIQREWLFQMPGDRTETALLFTLPAKGARGVTEVAATSTVVFEQVRIPEGVDYTAPPPTYHLVGLSASTSRRVGKGELLMGLRASNLFNTAYREYMDRFRYYADARGTDITLWITYAFGAPSSH